MMLEVAFWTGTSGDGLGTDGSGGVGGAGRRLVGAGRGGGGGGGRRVRSSTSSERESCRWGRGGVPVWDFFTRRWQCGCNIGQLLILLFVELGFWSFAFLHCDWAELPEASFSWLFRSALLCSGILRSVEREDIRTGPKSPEHPRSQRMLLTHRPRSHWQEPEEVGDIELKTDCCPREECNEEDWKINPNMSRHNRGGLISLASRRSRTCLCFAERRRSIKTKT